MPANLKLSVDGRTVLMDHQDIGRAMFDRDVDYPMAVASGDDEGVIAAIDWCVEQMHEGDRIAVWTSLKSNLTNNSQLSSFVSRHGNVEHIAGRGRGRPSGPGPVLMAWADMDDIAELTHFGHGIRALCVITWNEDGLRPWVSFARPTILGDGTAWEEETASPDPIVVEAMKSLTLTINHNNTISGGFEKDQVVGVLLALRDARIPMESGAMEGWAVAHGWTGDNPKRLAGYVQDINAGKRPRSRHTIRRDYIDILRKRLANGDED